VARKQRESLTRSERRMFLVGAFGLLLAVVLLARIQVASIDRSYSQVPLQGVKVNVNTADEHTLALLNQIGPERARQIILHRDQYGPFRALPDLLRVQGIGRKTVEGLVDQICFDDSGTGEFGR